MGGLTTFFSACDLYLLLFWSLFLYLFLAIPHFCSFSLSFLPFCPSCLFFLYSLCSFLSSFFSSFHLFSFFPSSFSSFIPSIHPFFLSFVLLISPLSFCCTIFPLLISTFVYSRIIMLVLFWYSVVHIVFVFVRYLITY